MTSLFIHEQAAAQQIQAEKERPIPKTVPHITMWPELHVFEVNNRQHRVKFQVDRCLNYVKLLGSGAYGVVIAASDSRTKRKVAVKKIPGAWKDLSDGHRILREITILQHLNHPNIVRLLDIVNPPEGAKLDDVYLVQELMDTDLRKVIYSMQTLDEDHTQYFVYQLLKALKYIHSAGIIHRDLKPGNLLVNIDCTLKVCDFGLARSVDSKSAFGNEQLTEYVVTRWYRAPELLCHAKSYGPPVDMWSVGCIMAELLGRNALFQGESSWHQMQLILNILGTPSEQDMAWITSSTARRYIQDHPATKIDWKVILPKCGAQALDLLDKMLQFDPAKRITVDEALEHPFVGGFHDPKHEVVCVRKLDAEFDKLQFTEAMLQDFAWESIYKFRPAIRPAGPSRVPGYFEELRRREAKKAELREARRLKSPSVVVRGRDAKITTVPIPTPAVPSNSLVVPPPAPAPPTTATAPDAAPVVNSAVDAAKLDSHLVVSASAINAVQPRGSPPLASGEVSPQLPRVVKFARTSSGLSASASSDSLSS